MKSLRDPFLLTLKLLRESVDKSAKLESEPRRLNLARPREYDLFSVSREFSSDKDEANLNESAQKMERKPEETRNLRLIKTMI